MLILVTPVVLTLGIGLFVFFDRHWSTTTANLTNSLAGEIAIITDSWENQPSSENRLRLIVLAKQKLGLTVHVAFIKKLPQTHKINIPGVTDALEKALSEKLDNDFSVKPHLESKDIIVISVSVPDGLLEIHVPKKRLFSTTTYVFLLFMVGSGLFLSLVAVIFMRNQIRPVRKLAVVAEKFGKGIDMPRYTPKGAKEVRQAAQAFLDMRERIKRQIRQRTDMLSGVSHDLRTPLTRLKLQLSMLPSTVEIDAMQDDITAMEKMIRAYLDFAKSETLEQSSLTDIAGLLRQTIQDAGRQGSDIAYIIPDKEVYMTVRPQAISRVFANIIDNARIYAKKTRIKMVVLTNSIEITIDDDGPGIPLERQEDAFKPFHRLDESRNQNIEGTGLGLTIARDITQSHGGTITLGVSPESGLRVIIWLPL